MNISLKRLEMTQLDNFFKGSKNNDWEPVITFNYIFNKLIRLKKNKQRVNKSL